MGINYRFEFTIELFWKLLKVILEAKGVEVRYPREVLIEAYSGNLLNDEGIWLFILKDHNLASHVHEKSLADEMYKRVINLLEFYLEQTNMLWYKKDNYL